MIESLWLQIGPVFNQIPINLTSEGARGHHRIITALNAGDAKAARAALTEDLMKATFGSRCSRAKLWCDGIDERVVSWL